MIKRKNNKTLKHILIGVSIIPIAFVGTACISAFNDVFIKGDSVEEEGTKDIAKTPIEEQKINEEKTEDEKLEELNKVKEKQEKDALERINKIELDATKEILKIAFQENKQLKLADIEFSSSGRIKLIINVIDNDLKDDIILSKLLDENSKNELYKFEYDTACDILYNGIVFKDGIEKTNKEDFLKEYAPGVIFNDTNGKTILRLYNYMIKR